jgi:hypothetical protein
MEPTTPKPVYMRPMRMGLENGGTIPQKQSLASLDGVVHEWKYGSKKRVVKYSVMYVGVSLVVAILIGVIAGLCTARSEKA